MHNIFDLSQVPISQILEIVQIISNYRSFSCSFIFFKVHFLSCELRSPPSVDILEMFAVDVIVLCGLT